MGRLLSGNFAEMMTSTPFRDLLRAANLQHETSGFTSPPKEGLLRIFSPLKIRRLRPGLNPQTWVLKASTLPIDHQSRIIHVLLWKIQEQNLYIFWGINLMYSFVCYSDGTVTWKCTVMWSHLVPVCSCNSNIYVSPIHCSDHITYLHLLGF